MASFSDRRRAWMRRPGRVPGMVYMQNIAAATTTGGITQLSLSGAGPFTAVGLVSPLTPRNVRITVTDANASITAFTIRVTGTAPDGTVVSEVFKFAGGLVQTGVVVFATITQVYAIVTGGAAGDTLDLGYQTKLGLPVPFGSTELTIEKLKVGDVNEAASAVDQVNNSFTPTTAPNGTNDYEVWFSYT